MEKCVESEFGHGATFIIELPIVESPPVEITNSNQIKAQPPLEKNGKILVVDVSQALKLFLSADTYWLQSDTITDGKIATDKLDTGEIYDVLKSSQSLF